MPRSAKARAYDVAYYDRIDKPQRRAKRRAEAQAKRSCRCVHCCAWYDPAVAQRRGAFRGLCSMACQHAFAYEHGWRRWKGRPEHDLIGPILAQLRAVLPGADRD